MWSAVVALLQGLIFSLGHFAGESLGAGIFLTALLLRVGFLPLSLHLARRARRQQELYARLQPRLRALQEKFKKDPARLGGETLALFRTEGYRPVDGRALLGGLIQAPPLSAMYAALRSGIASGVVFGWIPNLARPDALLVALVALLSAGAAWLGMPPAATRNALMLSVVLAGGLTFAFLFSTSSAMALSFAANGVIGVGQNWWLRREGRRDAALRRG